MRYVGLLAVCGVLVLSACDGSVAWEQGRVQLLWREQETLFAMSPQQGRIDAYRLHGGLAWLGGSRLPAGQCFDELQFDPVSARLWVRGTDGGVLLDARRMREIARWDGERAPAALRPPETPGADADIARGDACAGRRLALAGGDGR